MKRSELKDLILECKRELKEEGKTDKATINKYIKDAIDELLYVISDDLGDSVDDFNVEVKEGEKLLKQIQDLETAIRKVVGAR
jgi:gas vesicle protein